MNPNIVTEHKTINIIYRDESILVTKSSGERVKVNGKAIFLSPKEVELLTYLASGQGTVRTKLMIMNELYPFHKKPELKIVDVMVCKIRKKLAADDVRAAEVIRTARGRGYAVSTPLKEPIPIRDEVLPDQNCRWDIADKAKLIEILRSQRISADTILDLYPDMSAEELLEWGWKYDEYGHEGLRSTRTLDYPLVRYKQAA